MPHRIEDIAVALGADALGAIDMQVTGLSEPASAGETELALAMTPKFADDLSAGNARAAVVWEGADWASYGLDAAIVIPRPRYAMAGLTAFFAGDQHAVPGIHPSAVIAASAEIGAGAMIGPFAVVGENTVIGANARIDSHASIGSNVVIGADLLIHAGARIHRGAKIGDRFILHPNAVIGADGFSFVTPEKSNMENVRETLGNTLDAKSQTWVRIHSLGGVKIGDDVEIGANSTVDQGTIRATKIGRGTKIDNQVQIGHNVVVGEDCLICAAAAVAGSSTLGDRVVMGGQSGLTDNAFIGADSVIGAGTKLLSSVPAGSAMLGYPGVRMDQQVEIYKATRRLPKLVKTLKSLQIAVSKLEDND